LTDSHFKILSLLRVVDATQKEIGDEPAPASTRGKRGGAKRMGAAARGEVEAPKSFVTESGESERVWRVGAPYPVTFGAKDRNSLTDRIARSLPSVAVVESVPVKSAAGA